MIPICHYLYKNQIKQSHWGEKGYKDQKRKCMRIESEKNTLYIYINGDA